MDEAGAKDGDRQARRDWIRRVLGAEIPILADGGDLARQDQDIVGIWWNARDSINEQIEALRHAILNTGHPLAVDACENGLAEFTGGVLVRFQAAVLECRNATPEALEQARQNVAAYGALLQTFIASSDTLPLIEDNPWGIQVTIRQDVGRAVAAILQHTKP